MNLTEEVILDYRSDVQNEPRLPDLMFQLNPLYFWWWRINQGLDAGCGPQLLPEEWVQQEGSIWWMSSYSLIKTESRLHPRMRGIGKVVWHRRDRLFLTWCVTLSKTLFPYWILSELGLTYFVTTQVPSLVLGSWRGPWSWLTLLRVQSQRGFWCRERKRVRHCGGLSRRKLGWAICKKMSEREMRSSLLWGATLYSTIGWGPQN